MTCWKHQNRGHIVTTKHLLLNANNSMDSPDLSNCWQHPWDLELHQQPGFPAVPPCPPNFLTHINLPHWNNSVAP